VVVVGVIFARLNVDAMLPTFEEAIEEWRPDLIVREGSEFASAVAADLHGVRHVRVAVGFSLAEEAALALAMPALDERRPGLSARIAGSAYLTCFPESIDPPRFPVTRFRAPATETVPQSLPDWWPGDERPLVYVSFGSVAATFPPAAQVYESALDGVATLPVRGLLTTGGNDLQLPEVPANVHVEWWVDEADVLTHAFAAVGHGGAGTTLSALAARRMPLLVVPLFGNQPTNAVRVAAAGAGVVASFDGIRGGLELILENDRYREASRRISEEMRALPAIDGFLASVIDQPG